MAIFMPGVSIDMEQGPRDVARAIGEIEIINHQDSMSRHDDCPWIAEVAIASVIAEDELVRLRGIRALGIQDARPDAEGRMAVAINQKHPLVGQANGVMRMALESCILPLKTPALV